ncbi:MAG TPA: hypothetical protein VGN83_10470 [Falsiroseomonas sp.]|jgi:hypothetical protein|nr:hypothetical protein [Falsiroseomonas sp.]
MSGRIAALLLTLLVAPPAIAQPSAPSGWPEVKCARYTEAWSEALTRFGRQGLGQAFLESHAAFLASGCRARTAICPRSTQELDLANALTIAAMNAGTASTFVPFRCPG